MVVVMAMVMVVVMVVVIIALVLIVIINNPSIGSILLNNLGKLSTGRLNLITASSALVA